MAMKKNIQGIFNLLIIALAVCCIEPANAVDGLTGKTKISVGEKAQIAEFYMIKDAIRIEFSEPFRSFNGYIDTMVTHKDGTLYSINEQGQAYVTKTGNEKKQTSVTHRSALEETCEQPKTTCKSLGQKTIAGRPAQGYKITDSGEASIVWLDKETGYALVGKTEEDGKFITEWKVIEAQARDISQDKFIVENAKENKGMQELQNSLKKMQERLKQQRQKAMQGG